jgi:hypothetical protein
MLALKRVIGRVLATIRAVLPVRQTQDSQNHGNSNTVEHKHQRATKGSRLKPSRAQAGIQAQLRKTETSCAPTRTKKLSTHGTQLAIPVPLAAPKKSKRKPSLALSTTVAPLHKHARKAAQAINGVDGKQQAIPVFPILRPAKSKPKRKA